MSKQFDAVIDDLVKRKKRIQIFKHRYYSSQFDDKEQKIINQTWDIISENLPGQKEIFNYEEAKFLCYYFFSVFEISRDDIPLLDKELLQLYHFTGQTNEARKVIDVILNIKNHNPYMQQRSMGQYNQSDIAAKLSQKQILQIQKTWFDFDKEEQGYIPISDADKPIYKLLLIYGINKDHQDWSMIKEFIDEWKQKPTFFLFFEEFASAVCEMNSKFQLLKKGRRIQSCACNIF